MSRAWCHTARWPTGVAILILSASSIAAQSPITTHHLTVSRFVEVDFTDQDAREVLKEMGGVLQTDDSRGNSGPGDIECPVSFELVAPVDVFDAGTGTISTEEDFHEVISQPGDVKVVETVDWCERPNPAFVGCARRGDSFVVEAAHADDFAGALWAHEFGHVKNLDHRRNESLMTMNEVVSAASRRVDGDECAAYR